MWEWIVEHPIPVLLSVVFALAVLGFVKPLRWLARLAGWEKSKIDVLEKEVRGRGKR